MNADNLSFIWCQRVYSQIPIAFVQRGWFRLFQFCCWSFSLYLFLLVSVLKMRNIRWQFYGPNDALGGGARNPEPIMRPIDSLISSYDLIGRMGRVGVWGCWWRGWLGVNAFTTLHRIATTHSPYELTSFDCLMASQRWRKPKNMKKRDVAFIMFVKSGHGRAIDVVRFALPSRLRPRWFVRHRRWKRKVIIATAPNLTNSEGGVA